LRKKAAVLRRALLLALALTAFAAVPAQAEIVADLGFRPNPDGFSFPNYGAGRANLNTVEMQKLFGRQVCPAGKGQSCVLRPGVRTLMRSINRGMSNGHCYGFAAVAESIYKGLLPRLGYTSLSQLGAKVPDPTTFDIPLEGNRKIQRLIARTFTFQMLPRVRRAQFVAAPSGIVDKLRQQLSPGAKEAWTVVASGPNGAGGHAVTPYAIDELGDGKYDILVYDNNWPGQERRVRVDVETERWEYEIFPEVLWYGDAKNKSLAMHPVSAGFGTHPCPVCAGRAGWHSKFNDITVDGAAAEHAHIVLRDKRGRRTGIVGGKLVNEIPGVRVVQRAGTRIATDAEDHRALVSAEPLYRVPKGKRVRITVDGRHLGRRIQQVLTVVGPTFDATAQRLVLGAGERATFVLDPRKERLRYVPAPSISEAAVRFGAELRKHKRTAAAYEIEVAAIGLPKGARAEYRKRPQLGLLQFGHKAAKRTRVRYRVRIKEQSVKKGEIDNTIRTRYFTLAGRKGGPRSSTTAPRGRPGQAARDRDQRARQGPAGQALARDQALRPGVIGRPSDGPIPTEEAKARRREPQTGFSPFWHGRDRREACAEGGDRLKGADGQGSDVADDLRGRPSRSRRSSYTVPCGSISRALASVLLSCSNRGFETRISPSRAACCRRAASFVSSPRAVTSRRPAVEIWPM